MSEFLKKLQNSPIYLMEDVGLTCGGDFNRTMQLIDIASKLGFDAVKLQMLVAEELLGDRSVTYTYPTVSGEEKTENMLEMLKILEFSDEQWFEIVGKIKNFILEFI